MKSSMRMLTLFAATGIMSGGFAQHSNSIQPKDIDVKPVEPPTPKGHKKFEMKGKTIWALNYKNAKKKLERMQTECVKANHAGSYEIRDLADGDKLCMFCETRIKKIL